MMLFCDKIAAVYLSRIWRVGTGHHNTNSTFRDCWFNTIVTKHSIKHVLLSVLPAARFLHIAQLITSNTFHFYVVF